MSDYRKKLDAVRNIVYSNDTQISSVIRIKNYIENHFETDLNLDVLSQTELISKYHLLRLFKKYYGQTPRQYLIDKRLEKSKNLLTNGISVTETCYAVGFESIGSFSSLFKRKIGKSPLQFQKEQFSRNKLD
ncbi:helix-turn-helix domain-containing protein [Winogradskyella jejuensis]|uniref:Helix-turn-helix domain-containing protein n=1 Tax=Winogradskyella jejuensis TaxID=1089305 RepID=A0A1M5PK22_9FLAO|nr:AraC family transcriptional regulator [Winogradskyella jejuensis]SHH01543.1 Helix-turn-helix domain-containing protein [Winogradskyella jejuensis]